MIDERKVLEPEEFKTFRNVQAVAALFVLLGLFLLLCGYVGVTGSPSSEPKNQIPVAAAIAMLVIGLFGFVGGIAALKGNRQFAPMMYVMAGVYVLAFPLGTFLSVVLFRDLRKYLHAKDKLRAAEQEARSQDH